MRSNLDPSHLILLLGASLLLSSCASSALVLVQWHRVEDVHEFCVLQGAKVKDGHKVLGCQWRTNDGICHIAAKDFTSQTDAMSQIALGHELKHCFDGSWHN